jgi:hypothetical protein
MPQEHEAVQAVDRFLSRGYKIGNGRRGDALRLGGAAWKIEYRRHWQSPPYISILRFF